MAVREIVTIGHPVLRERARPVGDALASAEVQSLIDDLVDTMRAAGGAGLAAPQVGVPLRVYVAEVRDNPRYPYKPNMPLRVLVDPEVRPLSDETFEVVEGCLSIPPARAARRHAEVEVSYLDRDGERHVETIRGLSAGTFQHEQDHLDGVPVRRPGRGHAHARELGVVRRLPGGGVRGRGAGDRRAVGLVTRVVVVGRRVRGPRRRGGARAQGRRGRRARGARPGRRPRLVDDDGERRGDRAGRGVRAPGPRRRARDLLRGSVSSSSTRACSTATASRAAGSDRRRAAAPGRRSGARGAVARRPWRPGSTPPRFLERARLPPGAREAILARLEVSYRRPSGAASPPRRSPRGSRDLDGPVPDRGRRQPADRAAPRRAARLAVQLACAVHRIEWDEDGVRVAEGAGRRSRPRRRRRRARERGRPHRVRAGAARRRSPTAYAASRTGTRRSCSSRCSRRRQPSAVLSVPERYWTWTSTGADGGTARGPRVRGLGARARRARCCGRPRALARVGRAAAAGSRARSRRGPDLHLGRRPLGRAAYSCDAPPRRVGVRSGRSTSAASTPPARSPR